MTIQKLSKYTLLILVCVIMTFCTTNKGVNNPLLEEWTGPYGGLPAFDQIDIADVRYYLSRIIYCFQESKLFMSVHLRPHWRMINNVLWN